MANLNTASLNDFVKLADVIWTDTLDSLPAVARNSGIFKMDPIATNTGESREYSEIDLEEYANNKDEGDDADQARVQQGFSNTLTLVRRGLDESITWEMRNRNKAPEVISRLTNLGKTLVNRLDLDLSHRITFGTATSFVDKDGISVDIATGDGLALFSTAHTLKGSSTTYRNRLANNPQLSKGSLEGMEKLIVEETLNQFGEKMTIPFDILYTTDDPNTVNTTRELLQSTAEVSAPNAGVVNVYQAKYRHEMLPRIATTAAGAVDSTKAKFWGIASSSDSTLFLGMEQEPTLNSPSATTNAEDVSSEDWTFTARTSYGIVAVGARFIKFSSGDGTA